MFSWKVSSIVEIFNVFVKSFEYSRKFWRYGEIGGGYKTAAPARVGRRWMFIGVSEVYLRVQTLSDGFIRVRCEPRR